MGLTDSNPSKRLFIDGTGITPGSEKCQCKPSCEFPCWQRLGIAPPCPDCVYGGCPVDTGWEPPKDAEVVAIR